MAQHRVSYQNFQMTVGGVRDLALEWLASAIADDDPFRSLLFSWISFNSWGTSVTEQDRDVNLKELLSKSAAMNASFNALFINDQSFRANVNGLIGMFPIFDGRAYRRKSAATGVDIPLGRAQFDTLGVQWNIKKSPPNWTANNTPTWEHCLSGIYQIRCNLFHGQKQQTVQSNQQVSRFAKDVLIGFIAGSNCFDWYVPEMVTATLR